MPRSDAPAGPRVDEHRARKEYLCGDPDNTGCARKIIAGRIYVSLSYGPGTPPFRAATWVIVRCCQTCRPPETADTEYCPLGAGGETCLLPAGHLEQGHPHQYQQGLF